MKLLIVYILNVLAISLPLAAFEVYLERFKSGWDGEFFSPFWGKKIRIKVINSLFQKAYVTPYHLIMFGIIIPIINVVELFILYYLDPNSNWATVSIGNTRIVTYIFLPTVWLGVSTFEDFLWFVINAWGWFNPCFPNALQKLFKGEFKWHTKWIKVRGVMLPNFYLTAPIWIALLFIAHSLILKYVH